MSKDWDPETVFEVLGSQAVRQLLAAANLGPVSVPDLAAELEASEATIYRRVDVCQEYDLLREYDRIDDDGNHYKAYETSLERVCFELDGGAFTVDIELRRDLVEDTSVVEDPPEE